MHQLVQFRQLTSELNKSELKQFFSTLIEDESFDEEFIITSMFNQMHKTLYHPKQSPIQTINNTITNIINEREISVDDSITFDSLSSTIINEIGSYLTIKEICNFEKTNRQNFISLRYPYPALYSIGFNNTSWTWLNAYSENQLFDFAQIKGVKKLMLHGDNYYELQHKFECEIIFSKVENLCLAKFDSYSLSFIFEKNNCNYTSLKHLSLSQVTIDTIEDVTALRRLLTTNKELKSLYLSAVISFNNELNIKEAIFIDPSIIPQQLSNLKALRVIGCDFPIYEQIVCTLNNQIESLHIGISADNIINIQNGYPNLKEFCVDGGLDMVEYAVNEIMKNSKKMQQINLVIISMNTRESKEFSEVTQALAPLLDLKLLQLQLFDLENGPKCIRNIWNSLNQFFMNHKRDMFKLMMEWFLDTYCDEQILTLTAIMNTWITQFSFVFINIHGELKEETVNTLKQIANVKCHKIGENLQKYSKKAVKYVISSNGDIHIPCIYTCESHMEYEPTCAHD